jgi:hypothetical protein
MASQAFARRLPHSLVPVHQPNSPASAHAEPTIDRRLLHVQALRADISQHTVATVHRIWVQSL